MPAQPGGWFELVTNKARTGTRYRYRIDGKLEVPDPASRANPEDIQGPSEVIDPASFEWNDDEWRGRPWHEAVIYELHVGTFSPEGTFAGAEKKLDHLQELGITVIELMPIADFPGKRGWGYDGVLQFAPESAYGRLRPCWSAFWSSSVRTRASGVAMDAGSIPNLPRRLGVTRASRADTSPAIMATRPAMSSKSTNSSGACDRVSCTIAIDRKSVV